MPRKNREDMSRDELLSELGKLDTALSRLTADAVHSSNERLLYDLHVHQVELESQNQALRDMSNRLEAQTAKYADLYDFAPVGYCTLDADETIHDINLTGAAMLGRPRDQLVGETFSLIAPLQERQGFKHHMSRCLREKSRVVSELVFARRWPRTRTIQLISEPLREHDRPVTSFRTVMIDVTAQKRLEEKLRMLSDAAQVLSSTLDYGAIVEAAARFGVPTLADFCLIQVASQTGRGERTTVAWPSSGRFQPLAEGLTRLAARRELESPQDRVMTSGEPILLEQISDDARAQLSYDDGQVDLLRLADVRSVMIVPIAGRGRVMGTLTLVATESERSYGQNELKLAQDLATRIALALDNARLYTEAHDAVGARDATLALVSHDLRNPLAVILMKATLLLRSQEERRSETRKAVDAICRSAERMTRLIQDLLEVASLEAGRFSLERRRWPVGQVVAEALEAARAEAAKKDLRLEADFSHGDRFELDCDRDRVLQVLGNLLGNAVKFTEPPGRITVRVEPSDREARFAITDTGPGISEADQPHVFDRFWQAQKTARLGTGLGLSIAKGIVEAHGGRIWLESRLGVGTTVFFTLPLVRPQLSQLALPPPRPSAPPSRPARRVVLLAEDDVDVREVLVETLEACGYQVLAATNGSEALDLLRTAKAEPALIVLDLLMPVMDGWEFLAERARDPALEKIPVVVLSGERDVEQRLKEAHASFIAKPVAIEQLVQTIDAQARA